MGTGQAHGEMRQTPAAFRKSPMVVPGAAAGASKSPTKHKRVDSEQFIEPEENMNVSWLDGRGTWLAYVLVLAGIRLGEVARGRERKREREKGEQRK